MYGAYQLKYTPNATETLAGANLDVKKRVSLSTTGAAMDLYKNVSERLLHVNCWNELSGTGGKQYRLFDKNGTIKIGKAEEGDFIRFDLPMPHLNGAQRYDWVKIERILNVKFGDKDSVAIRVQPAQNPTERESEENFSGPTTNTFIAERIGNTVTVAIYPRHQQTDVKEVGGFYSRLHNFLAEVIGWRRVSETQWNKLADGLLSGE